MSLFLDAVVATLPSDLQGLVLEYAAPWLELQGLTTVEYVEQECGAQWVEYAIVRPEFEEICRRVALRAHSWDGPIYLGDHPYAIPLRTLEARVAHGNLVLVYPNRSTIYLSKWISDVGYHHRARMYEVTRPL